MLNEGKPQLQRTICERESYRANHPLNRKSYPGRIQDRVRMKGGSDIALLMRNFLLASFGRLKIRAPPIPVPFRAGQQPHESMQPYVTHLTHLTYATSLCPLQNFWSVCPEPGFVLYSLLVLNSTHHGRRISKAG